MIDARQRRIAYLVAGCFFMENLDGTIVTTAAPRIGADLHVPSTAVGLVVTSYLVTLAVLIPLSGWMVARYGSRRVFLAAIVVFTVASMLCATSVNLGELVVMRVLQGAGGAMMVPVGRLTVLANAAKTDMMRLMSFIVWPGLVAPVIAPLAGGVITTYTSWRWLFLINVPLGLAAVVVASRLMPSSAPSEPPRLDWQGVVLTCVALGGLTWDAHLLSEPASPWGPVVVIGVGASAVLAASIRHLRRASDPLVDLGTLEVRSFRQSVSGSALFWVTVGAVPFLLPLLFENVFGWSAIRSGALVLWVFVGNIAVKPTTTFLLNRFGFRRILLGATLGVAATVAAAGAFTAATPLVVIIVVACASGVARSIGLTAYSTLSFADMPAARMRHANSLAATVTQVSLGFGVAASTVALRAGAPLSRLVTGHATQAGAYRTAFFLVAAVALGATVSAARLAPDAGRAVRRDAGARA